MKECMQCNRVRDIPVVATAIHKGFTQHGDERQAQNHFASSGKGNLVNFEASPQQDDCQPSCPYFCAP